MVLASQTIQHQQCFLRNVLCSMYQAVQTSKPLQNSPGPGHIYPDVYASLFTVTSEHHIVSNEKIWLALNCVSSQHLVYFRRGCGGNTAHHPRSHSLCSWFMNKTKWEAEEENLFKGNPRGWRGGFWLSSRPFGSIGPRKLYFDTQMSKNMKTWTVFPEHQGGTRRVARTSYLMSWVKEFFVCGCFKARMIELSCSALQG